MHRSNKKTGNTNAKCKVFSITKSHILPIVLLNILFIFNIFLNTFAQQYVEYQIEEGDCLWTIARQFQLSVQDVTTVNNLDEAQILSPGSKIKIPQKQTGNSNENKDTDIIVHTVQKGESLWDIAQQYRLSLDCISSANNLNKPDSLYIGQEINIPIQKNENTEQEAKSALTYEEEKTNILDMNNSLNQEFRNLVKETEYAVKAGESLWTIAHNYQVSLSELTEINDLEDAEKLSVGQVIKIPLHNWTKDDEDSEEETRYEWVEHIVESGESVSLIAQKYHVPVETICELNQISLQDYVYPGQRIKIKVSEYTPTETLVPQETKAAVVKNTTAKDSTPEDDSKQAYYTVKKGDTLWSIAQSHSVSMEGILAVNYLSNKDVLTVGQRLEIPAMGGSGQSSSKVQTVEYTVAKGDSLWIISQKFDIKMHEIININQLQNITQLSVGQKLNIPATEKALAAVQSTKTSVVTVQEEKPKEIVHFVQKGETLWGISRNYGVSINTITTANRISESTSLVVGQKLVIPNVRDSAISSRSFIWPVNGLITSQFGMRTLGGRRDYHTGIDIDGKTGDPIRAAESGKVSFSGYINGYGNTVIIDHSRGFSTVYSHNSSNLVSEGQSVSKGDIICRLGATGNATGSHLHFEVRQDGKPINPINYLP
ncbi:MAG: LysM peptidoglycan-binding domain-containing protein [Atribacterota bacterium]|nr:LysM peptidoglycan-binding domain-containing protein [Atribacterota bacterium]